MKKILMLALLAFPFTIKAQIYSDTLRYRGTLNKDQLVFKIYPDNQHYSLEYISNQHPRLITGSLNSERGFKRDPDATFWRLSDDKKEKKLLNFVRLSNKKGLFIVNSCSRIIGKLEEF
jgi:hypothetical protein